jgi:hypothetical protein
MMQQSLLQATVDRGAIDAWNEYLMENKRPHPVKAEDVIYTLGRPSRRPARRAPTAS